MSPFDVFGVQGGDVLVGVNGARIGGDEDSFWQLAALLRGGTFVLEFDREGRPYTVEVRVLDC